jgi:hypothetical protein
MIVALPEKTNVLIKGHTYIHSLTNEETLKKTEGSFQTTDYFQLCTVLQVQFSFCENVCTDDNFYGSQNIYHQKEKK